MGRIVLALGFLVVCFPMSALSQENRRLSSLARSEVRDAERRLSELGFWTDPIDGLFDAATRTGLIAFQKWQRREVTGKLTRDEVEAIRAAHQQKDDPKAGSPKPKESGYAHVEVDIDRQVMLLVKADGSVKVLPVSTGSGKPFIEHGEQSVAYTPRGRFLVYEKHLGWEEGALGSMYYSNYISGGVAIHGHPSVPNYPASHGCIRIPVLAAREVSKLLPVGTIVLVYDKESFVSGKEWVENPELKEAVLRDSKLPDYTYEVIQKVRPRINRAE